MAEHTIRPRIVVAGSINMDLVVRCHTLPRPGETLTGQELLEIPGGKGANQAVACARLDADVSLIGRLGDDAFGQSLSDQLRIENVDLTCVRQSSRHRSGLAIIGVDDAGQNSIIVIPGANGDVTPDDISASLAVIQSADLMLVQFEIPMDAVCQAILAAREHGVPVIVDPAPAVSDPPQIVRTADWLVPNETEAEKLTGISIRNLDDARRACLSLHEHGCPNSVITLGSQGVMYCDESGQCHHITAPTVQAVDTTAAGDAFAGALAVALARRMTPIEAIRFACAAGAIAASRHGAQPSMPVLQDVLHLTR